MKGVRSFILSSFQHTNIIHVPLIAENILNFHHTTHSRATDPTTQHGLPTATRHALLAATTAHAQPARHATTSTVHVRNPSTTSPAATKRSSTPNANQRYNDLQQLHKPTIIHLHHLKSPRFRPSKLAHLPKTHSNWYHHRDDSPRRLFYREHMLGNLWLLVFDRGGRYRYHRRARRESGHQGYGHGAIMLGLETDLGEAGSCWGVGVLWRYGVW